MKLSYAGPASGSDANCSWEGNGKVGVGKMTITESRPNTAPYLSLRIRR